MWTPLDIPASPKQPFTDYSRWRLRDTYDGRHVWDFLKSDKELEAHPPSDADKYWLGLPLVSSHSSSSAPFPETTFV
jgi:lanosterol synthase